MKKGPKKRERIRRIPVFEKNAMTLEKFLERNKLSRSTYYALRKEGLGPDEMRFRRLIRISYRAERKWTRRMESEEIASADDVSETK